MEKVKYLPLGLFLSATAKALITSSNFIDVSLILVLGLIAAFYEFKSQEKKFEALKQELTELNLSFQKVKDSQDEVKGYMSGLKLNQQMRGHINVNK